MLGTLLIITFFLLASLLVCLLTLRLSINIKHLCLLFHSLRILTDFVKFWPPLPFILTPRLLNLTKISDPHVYFDPIVYEAPKSSHAVYIWLSSVNSCSKSFTLNSCIFSIFPTLEMIKLIFVGKSIVTFRPRYYYISLMDVAHKLIFITSYYIYFKLLMILFSI